MTQYSQFCYPNFIIKSLVLILQFISSKKKYEIKYVIHNYKICKRDPLIIPTGITCIHFVEVSTACPNTPLILYLYI